MKNGKSNYGSGLKIRNNAASTLSLIGQVSEGYRKSDEAFIRKRKYPKELMEAEEILYNFFTTPVKWNERNWKYKAAFAAALFALGGVAYASSDTVKKTVDKNYEKGSKFVKEKYANVLAPATSPLIDKVLAENLVANESKVKEPMHIIATPYNFTPDLKVFGSPEYVKRVNDGLEELKKTPDSFRINGMTAYEYATYYMDELYEGERENYIDVSKGQYPLNIISASNLIHISRHIEQGQNQTLLDEDYKMQKKYPDDGPSLFAEYDAVRLQVSWEKARNNLTDDEATARFNYAMKYYTNDSKYFAKSFPPPELK